MSKPVHGQRRTLRAVILFLVIFLGNTEIAEARRLPLPFGVRVITIGEMEVATIYVHPDGSVINFPIKPDIHVGKKGAFDIAFVENDLVVSGITPGAKTNLFIYILGRRFTLKLLYNGKSGDQIVAIRDPKDARWEVPFTND